MFKPYDLANWTTPNSTRKRVVEIISHPIGDGTIQARMVPGDATTMENVKVSDLVAHQKQRWVQVARVYCKGWSFPEDMLRYDYAALYDHKQPEAPEDPETGSLIYRPTEPVLIYRVVSRKSIWWTFGRWHSFGIKIEAAGVRDLKDIHGIMEKH